MDSIRLLGLEDNTAVVFVSDNGGLSSLTMGRETGPTSNRPLRAGKGYLYEGGVRIPFIIHDPTSPSSTLSSSTVRSDIGSTVDVVPTLLDLASIEGTGFDGISMMEESGVDRPKFFHFPHYHGSGNRPSGSMISGRYKIIEWFETGEIELYDLADDEAELNDLSAAFPQLTDSLFAQLKAWRLEVDANMPSPNPDWKGN